MKRIFFITLIFSFTFLNSNAETLSNSKLKTTVSVQDLEKCYSEHPIFKKLLVEMTDQEFEDISMKEQRTLAISEEFKSDPNKMMNCLEKILIFAKAHEGADIFLHVMSRLGEVTHAAFSKSNKNNSTASLRKKDNVDK